jgi:hypothetical protein
MEDEIFGPGLPILTVESMPFGGTRSSGLGQYYGKDGFDMLTHAKSMLVSPPDVGIDHLYPRIRIQTRRSTR